MTAREVLTKLEKLGKPQTAAIYKRHGSGERVFGTLTSELGKLQKQIKLDHALAMELWKSGNAEARVLTLLIADPSKVTPSMADGLIKDGPVRFLSRYLAEFLARSPIADDRMRAWMKSPDESRRELGFEMLSFRLKNDPTAVSDAEAGKILATIEREIHESPNWARRAMNGAIIAIGVYKPALRKAAIAAGKRIGKVDVDHGETNCKTPEAGAYIEKAAKRAVAGRSKRVPH
jgi:3-methyladenine DNA glycosylase AlkD